jgi:hypothetical protein
VQPIGVGAIEPTLACQSGLRAGEALSVQASSPQFRPSGQRRGGSDSRVHILCRMYRSLNRTPTITAMGAVA